MAMTTCSECKKEKSSKANQCFHCGYKLTNRSVMIVLALFLGGFGAHEFYFNRPRRGFLYLLFCWTLIPALIALLQALDYLIMSEKEYYRYISGAYKTSLLAKILSLVFIIFGITIIAYIGWQTSGYAVSTSHSTASGGLFTSEVVVRYVVSGSASSASITYISADGSTSQLEKVYLPWSSEEFIAKKGDVVTLLAQNQGENGTVTASIYLNGKMAETTTSSGAFVIAHISCEVK